MTEATGFEPEKDFTFDFYCVNANTFSLLNSFDQRAPEFNFGQESQLQASVTDCNKIRMATIEYDRNSILIQSNVTEAESKW